ncbi:hypothetical protein [Limosilactobacillus antri]|uniref:hypothetical protein n=1 Tax=Limosilactobacillus antri TaxID=227943 RepID=UPI001F586AE6|nr:hypothetical protein [Limosilactobacillus antri]
MMNAQELAKVWDIDNQTMLDYMLAISGDDIMGVLYCTGRPEVIIDEDNIDRVELDGEQVSKILKLYVEDSYLY